MEPIEKIIRMELDYKQENFQQEQAYDIISGSLPVIISAPHSVTHFRDGKPKQGEFMTGVLAKYLQKRLDCWCITKTRNDRTDPNFDPVHPYKQAICDLVNDNEISLLIDLHIMAPKRPAAIEIGTGKGKNVFHDGLYAQVLKHHFETSGISPVIVDERFTGGFPYTVSSNVSSHTNIPCVQIEINWRLLDLTSGKHQFFTLLESMATSIKQVRSTP
ncbi:N-formylglutamate amidohydrolase [Neobacillus sp. Marseille-QA0830]